MQIMSGTPHNYQHKAPASSAPSRSTILSWIHSILPDVLPNIKIQSLGKGNIYCRLINHYFPNIISLSRIICSPKNEYENVINLKILQNALSTVKLSIYFEPSRIAKEKMADNWNLIITLYKAFNGEQSHDENGFMFGRNTNKKSVDNSMLAERSLNFQMTSMNNLPNLPPNPFEMLPSFKCHQLSVQKQLFSQMPKQNQNNLNSFPTMSPSKPPTASKGSLNSHMFQNNLVPIIDRVKQILLKPSHDIQKIRQIKMVLNIPIKEEAMVKEEEDDRIDAIIKIGQELREKESTELPQPKKCQTFSQPKEQKKSNVKRSSSKSNRKNFKT